MPDNKNEVVWEKLSTKVFSDLEDWELFGYPNKTAWADFIEFNKTYEVFNCDDEDDSALYN